MGNRAALSFIVAHVLIGKPVPAFPGHALVAMAIRRAKPTGVRRGRRPAIRTRVDPSSALLSGPHRCAM